jgi:hypothetical protein
MLTHVIKRLGTDSSSWFTNRNNHHQTFQTALNILTVVKLSVTSVSRALYLDVFYDMSEQRHTLAKRLL